MSAFTRRARPVALAGLAIAGIVLAGCAGGSGASQSSGPVTLTWFSGAGVEANTNTMEALAKAFHEKNPDITIKVDASGPSGPELDGVMKTRLATGEMPDIFWYNSGSLLQTLSPDTTMLNVFRLKDDKVFHFWGTEMTQAVQDPGQDHRAIDFVSPVFNLLDATPEGRGDFYTKLNY